LLTSSASWRKTSRRIHCQRDWVKDRNTRRQHPARTHEAKEAEDVAEREVIMGLMGSMGTVGTIERKRLRRQTPKTPIKPINPIDHPFKLF
jgi:hypothetical protein